jgi:hypothetical protein
MVWPLSWMDPWVVESAGAGGASGLAAAAGGLAVGVSSAEIAAAKAVDAMDADAKNTMDRSRAVVLLLNEIS